jgi:dihydropteroate synthase
MTRGEDSIVPGPLWRIAGRLHQPVFPLVMGILNATPDSFHGPSRVQGDELLRKAEGQVAAGAAILDLGGASSRPGAREVPVQEELDRVLPHVELLVRHFPDVIVSIDTWRAAVAREATRAGAGMVNDIGAGLLDPEMMPTVAAAHVPYVVMHMQGTPATMQQDPQYVDVVREVVHFLSERMAAARAAGMADVLVDPGFGFGKNTAHNYALLDGLPALCSVGVPVVVGVSRKRMINEVLGITAAEALNGTTVLNTLALLKGAHILRVHDVKEAMECVRLVERFRAGGRP